MNAEQKLLRAAARNLIEASQAEEPVPSLLAAASELSMAGAYIEAVYGHPPVIHLKGVGGHHSIALDNGGVQVTYPDSLPERYIGAAPLAGALSRVTFLCRRRSKP